MKVDYVEHVKRKSAPCMLNISKVKHQDSGEANGQGQHILDSSLLGQDTIEINTKQVLNAKTSH